MLVHRRLPLQLLLVPIYTLGLRETIMAKCLAQTENDLAKIRTRKLLLQNLALCNYICTPLSPKVQYNKKAARVSDPSHRIAQVSGQCPTSNRHWQRWFMKWIPKLLIWRKKFKMLYDSTKASRLIDRWQKVNRFKHFWIVSRCDRESGDCKTQNRAY
jgi:hypothetical protein